MTPSDIYQVYALSGAFWSSGDALSGTVRLDEYPYGGFQTVTASLTSPLFESLIGSDTLSFWGEYFGGLSGAPAGDNAVGTNNVSLSISGLGVDEALFSFQSLVNPNVTINIGLIEGPTPALDPNVTDILYTSTGISGTGGSGGTGGTGGSGGPGNFGGGSGLPLAGLDDGGNLIDTASCFLAGTRIRTPAGDRAVEALRIGDSVTTWSGASRPVRWIGRRAHPGGGASPQPTILPIRIAAGAIADGVPAHDLYLSPDHGVLVGGVLVPAGALVNGVTITQPPREGGFGYFHVELDRHDILFAEGTPAESFIDRDSAVLFDNAGSRVSVRRERDCVKRVETGPVLAAIRARLAARAGAEADGTTADAAVHLLADGQVIAPERDGDCLTFRLAALPRVLRLRSRSGVPAHLGITPDRRRLGLAVHRIAFTSADGVTTFPADSVLLRRGFYPSEGGSRWTAGDGELPIPTLAGPMTIEIAATPLPRYPLG